MPDGAQDMLSDYFKESTLGIVFRVDDVNQEALPIWVILGYKQIFSHVKD